MSEPAGVNDLLDLQRARAGCPFCGVYHEPEDCRATVERLYESEDAAPAPAAPYGQNTVWPHDLPERVEQTEAIIPAILRRLAAAEERLERLEVRLLLPGVPSEP